MVTTWAAVAGSHKACVCHHRGPVDGAVLPRGVLFPGAADVDEDADADAVLLLAGPRGCCMYPSSASVAVVGEPPRGGKRLRTVAAPGSVATPPRRRRADDEERMALMMIFRMLVAE